MAERILREPDVAERTGLSRTTRFEMERRGQFPRRRRVSHRVVGWIEAEVDEWIRSRDVEAVPPPEAA